MEYLRRAIQAVGPVVLGGCLLAVPLLFAPQPAQAYSDPCAGYDTVECSTLEYCIGVKYFGAGVCVTNVTYWPPVNVILQEAVEDHLNLLENMGDYVHGAGSGGGGAF